MLFLCFFNTKVKAQLGFCNGNSGDPIFTESFGTGVTNTPLPVGTTTYNFANANPQDGFYTVSSNTGFFDWHNIPDHTPGDTNGKCLIVNGDFATGEFYSTLINGLCENTSYEFSAWLINLLPQSGCGGNGIPINVRFQIWDSTNTSLLASGDTGNISGTVTPNWLPFALVFQTLPSQTSVILKMINNSAGGCGNDLAIDDLLFRSCGDAIAVEDTSNNTSVTLCSTQTPFSTTITAIPDNTVFTSYFYQWQESTDGNTWTDIIGETNQSINITGITSTMYYRAKVAEFAANLADSDCITNSDVFQIIVNQAPMQPSVSCWETATFNVSTCDWDITGAQPPMPSGLACWEIATFNNTTCVWEITGSQPTQPTISCWETATFNTMTCSWEVTGTQPSSPTGLACWETAIFNTITCSWEVTGTQPPMPSGLACWETATFNNVTCSWEVTGTQPNQPTISCWETVSFNFTNCNWEVTGTQPPAPTNLECWEVAMFNTILCRWEVTGTQSPAPTNLECWETASFNVITCSWDITGEEPIDFIEESLSFCEGENITLFANTTIANPMYLWDTGETTENIAVNTPGTYNVEITDNTCSTTIKTFLVSEIQAPIIEQVTSTGNDIIIDMLNSGDFEYSLDGITFELNATFYDVEGGLYTVYVNERNGCGVTSMVHLHFVIPKFFTPNGDGIHDTFDLKGIEYYNSSEVFIFDRYGKLLKSSKNQSFTWDGTFNNELLPNSDYWYIVKIDNQEFRGHFTLKR